MAHEVTGCFTGYADVQHLHLHNRGSCSPPWPPVKYGLGPPETGALQQQYWRLLVHVSAEEAY